MSPHIKIHWIGIRKDSGRGSVWGYFTQAGKKDTPNYEHEYYRTVPEAIPMCYEFRGSIGKKIHFIERELTNEFLAEVTTKKKNYRPADSEKIISRWGKSFEEEFSMQIMMMVIKG